jgi:hypothetical protein
MIRLFVRRRHRHPESDILCRGRHGRNDGQRLIHGPLRAGRNGGFEIARAFVDVVAAYLPPQ